MTKVFCDIGGEPAWDGERKISKGKNAVDPMIVTELRLLENRGGVWHKPDLCKEHVISIIREIAHEVETYGG